MEKWKIEVWENIKNLEKPKRQPWSKRIPQLSKLIIQGRQTISKMGNQINFRIARQRSEEYFKFIVARHQSVLRRKLGDSDPQLQERKITNLRLAANRLNGLVINPGEVFSFWETIGKPNYKDGYVDGMLLSEGKVKTGVGGGLCQLSNFLFWIFLHSPAEIVERHRHSMDVFPDSGRVLPFGSGATVFYNYIDLKVVNNSVYPLQLKVWLTDTHLKGQILCSSRLGMKYHVYERNGCFIKWKERFYRYNQIFKESRIDNKIISKDKVAVNLAPVLYQVDEEYLRLNSHEIWDIDKMMAERLRGQRVDKKSA
jgi:vancomycin resistance protein VanW